MTTVSFTLSRLQAERLLSKYYAGGTSVAEERQLLGFLRSPQCPPSMAPDRVVLEALQPLAALPDDPIPEGMERRLAQKLRRGQREKLGHRLVRWTASAAAVAAVVTVGMLRPPVVATVYADTCRTPREAALSAEHTLIYVSDNLNMALEAGESDLGGPCP